MLKRKLLKEAKLMFPLMADKISMEDIERALKENKPRFDKWVNEQKILER